ncbi:MAG TPA: fused MFS/spermidine synthase [Steroidobacteraceae bacterium]|nr:fused MFS/spermidine synthase [Steroidobacteraceae bacterium]
MLIAALTILLSSFLLFLVQPILAKQILPWFGGSAGVWTMCLVFFQLVLLFGYAYAHWLTRHGVRPRRASLHIVLLLASCLTLPIIPSSFWQPQHATVPALRILGLLAATVGLPYFLLASTAPLLQRWLSADEQNSAQSRSIYRLFALSNFGSLVGLLSYPFAIEPFATLRLQAWVWSSAYVLFVGCFISYAWKRRQSPELARTPTVDGGNPEPAPAPRTYVYWICCAALGSALLLSVTNQITQNVASIPFLWVVPLTMYLLSFIICFEGRSGDGWYDRRRWVAPAMLATGAMAWALFADRSNLSIFSAVPIFVIGILWGCVVCHGELARSKPSPAYLTHFYLCLATGGALGGLLVGIVAPLIFTSYWEMPLALIFVGALGVYSCLEETTQRSRTLWAANLLVALLGTALVLLLLGELPSALDPYTLGWSKIVMGDARWGCAALLIMAAFVLPRYRLSLAIALTALFCTLIFDWSYYQELTAGARASVRNFYGSLRVIDSTEGARHIRRLKHGVIVHGSQILEPGLSSIPTTYYGETSGIGRTLRSEHRTIGALRIGSVGLGAGTLAAYGEAGDLFRVYELNPAVLDIAQNQFSYLKNSKARIEPVLGDARLSLAFEIAHGAFDAPEQRFDVLSLDAFSGDAIPVHLLTREAFATYARALKPDGILAFHLSNQYLDLPPVVEQIARGAGFQAVLIADRPPTSSLSAASDWVLVTRNAAFLRQPDIAAHTAPIAARTGLPEWTDQFSNLFQILK